MNWTYSDSSQSNMNFADDIIFMLESTKVLDITAQLKLEPDTAFLPAYPLFFVSTREMRGCHALRK